MRVSMLFLGVIVGVIVGLSSALPSTTEVSFGKQTVGKTRVVDIAVQRVQEEENQHEHVTTVAVEMIVRDGVVLFGVSGDQPAIVGQETLISVEAVVNEFDADHTTLLDSKPLQVTLNVVVSRVESGLKVHHMVIEVAGVDVISIDVPEILLALDESGNEVGRYVSKTPAETEGSGVTVGDELKKDWNTFSGETKRCGNMILRRLKTIWKTTGGKVLLISGGMFFFTLLVSIVHCCCCAKRKEAVTKPKNKTVYLDNIKVHYEPLATGEKTLKK